MENHKFLEKIQKTKKLFIYKTLYYMTILVVSSAICLNFEHKHLLTTQYLHDYDDKISDIESQTYKVRQKINDFNDVSSILDKNYQNSKFKGLKLYQADDLIKKLKIKYNISSDSFINISRPEIAYFIQPEQINVINTNLFFNLKANSDLDILNFLTNLKFNFPGILIYDSFEFTKKYNSDPLDKNHVSAKIFFKWLDFKKD